MSTPPSKSGSLAGIPLETSDEAATMLFLLSEEMRRGDYATSWLAAISLFKAMPFANVAVWTPPIITLPTFTTMTGTFVSSTQRSSQEGR